MTKQAVESESQGIGPIEKDTKPEEPKEDNARANVLKGIRKLLSDCHGWSTNKYYQLLMDLAEMIDWEMREVEAGSKADIICL